jgi:hypothetical protein
MDVLNHFRGYPVYFVRYQQKFADGELFTGGARVIFKETMTDIWGVVLMGASKGIGTFSLAVSY